MGANGLNASLGMAEESVYGTFVTPTRFIEFTDDTVQKTIGRLDSNGLRAGGLLVRSTTQWQPAAIDAAGDLGFELQSKGIGLLLKHCFGSVTTTQPASGTDPTVYDHTFTLGRLTALTNPSLTLQVGFVNDAGAQQAKNIVGAMIGKLEIDGKVGALATCKATVNARDIDHTNTFATPSYASGLKPFSYAGGSITLGGNSLPCTDAKIAIDNKLDSKLYLGTTLKYEPTQIDYIDVTADVTADWTDWTNYDRLISGAQATLVLSFVGDVISHAYTYTVTISMDVRTDGDTPGIAGRARIAQPLKLVGLGANAISVVYRTTDTTP